MTAICLYCGRSMAEAATCDDIEHETPDGRSMQPIPYGQEEGFQERAPRCRGCNVSPGGFHHPGCRFEQCPFCGGQAVSCKCKEEVEEQDGA